MTCIGKLSKTYSFACRSRYWPKVPFAKPSSESKLTLEYMVRTSVRGRCRANSRKSRRQSQAADPTPRFGERGCRSFASTAPSSSAICKASRSQQSHRQADLRLLQDRRGRPVSRADSRGSQGRQPRIAAPDLYDNMVRPPSPAIASGTYFTYFSVPGRPELLMRSVTFVRREVELVTFRRVTRWGPGDGQGGARYARQPLRRGDLAPQLDLFQQHQPPPDRRAVRDSRAWAPISEPVLVGRAIVLTGSGPAFVSAIMRQDVTTIGIRQAMQMAHVVRLDDPGVDQPGGQSGA